MAGAAGGRSTRGLSHRLRHHWEGHHLPGRHRHPPALVATAALVSLAVLLPLIFLVVQACSGGPGAPLPPACCSGD